MQSKRSPKRLQKATKQTRMQAGSSTPRRHPPTEANSAHRGSEHSPTSARNSGSELSDSDLFPQSAARSRPHTSVSPSGDHYHLPSGRHHSHRSVSPSGEYPRTPHLPSGRHHSNRSVSPSGEHPCTPHLPSGRHHSRRGVSPSGEYPHTLHRLSRTHRSRRRHSNPRKRHRYQRSSDSSNSSSTSSSSSSSSSSSRSSSSSSSWTSDSDRGRYRRRKRAKQRKHHRRTHRHHSMDDWLNPAASGSIPCAPPLSRQLQHAIQRGKYVSFSKLLLPHNTPPIIKTKPHPKKTKQRVTDLCTWLEAWNRYLCTRVAANPSMALELVKYQTMMVMFFKHHPADACIQYDKLFRQAAAQDRTLRWDTIKNDIYVWAVTQPSLRQPGVPQRTQSFREKVPVLARLGPPAATPTSSNPTRVSHTPGGQEICRRFNYGKCTRGSECSFAHVCWHQGCLGDHPAKGCPKKSN